ncbi:ABC transporter, ATP-binding protein [Ancylostoma ceylanicum]|uniref:ABC transporter, ATP-binding protein n=1 Tax=Ancylostoma ceylanicum TaxID=53326 RepID=A0A0D6LX17_9BILA|nr:ABC transporter, ATP-binding protein [Ancylostoma ceylanicum]
MEECLLAKRSVRSVAARLGAQSNLLVDTVGDVSSYVLTLIPKIGSRVFGSHYPLAFQRGLIGENSTNFRAYFNNFACTTPPLAISLADSMNISEVLKKPITLKVSNHPFPPVAEDLLKNRNYSTISTTMDVMIIVSMSYIMAAYSQLIITEGIKKSKHMQILSGLRPWMYWITNFAWDFIYFVVQMAAFVGIFYAFNIVVYNNELAMQACQMVDCLNPFSRANTQCCGRSEGRIYTDHILTDSSELGIMLPVIFFGIQGFAYWYFVFKREYKTNSRLFSQCKQSFQSDENFQYNNRSLKEDGGCTDEDSDIAAEKSIAKAMDKQNTAVVVDGVKKWQDWQYRMFYSNSIKMLTGENDISYGDAFIYGRSVKTDWRKACANVGYCPQFDAVLEEMTGEETLYMFARIRGIPKGHIPQKVTEHVHAVIHTIGIGLYAKKLIKEYSGGNKRRLSLGIALVGMPAVLLLDEPTTGVDPKARRIIWNIFTGIRALGTSLVLTSHNMEECEALCTELAIMVDGSFKCYGSCQHIKSKYGAGFTLLIRLARAEQADAAKNEVIRAFPGAILKVFLEFSRGAVITSHDNNKNNSAEQN